MVRRNVLLDGGVAVGMAGACQAEMWLYDGGPAGVAAVTVAAALAFPATLALRSSRPELMVASASVVMGVQTILGGWLTTTLAVVFTAMLVMVSTGLLLPRRRALQWAGVFLAITWLDLAVRSDDYYGLVSDILFTSIIAVGAPVAAGIALRERRHRTEELERLNKELREERAVAARLAAADERTRIAREVHDVVAHSVSIMVVQAGAARRLLEQDPQESRASLHLVEQVGREALRELRRTLGLLRGSEGEGDLTPQPGLDRLPELVESLSGAGLDIALVVDDQSEGTNALSSGAELAAYRIVQEGLTNVIKHAHATTATVRLAWTQHSLELSISDDGSTAEDTPPAAGSSEGHGLRGMAERAEAYGGRVRAGRAADGGFAVEAWLPREVGAEKSARVVS